MVEWLKPHQVESAIKIQLHSIELIINKDKDNDETFQNYINLNKE